MLFGALFNRFIKVGGYILYARHAEATLGEDKPDVDFRFCNTQRNLSELGRTQAVYYGELLYKLLVPLLSPIISSPYCRAIETAQLAFRDAKIQIDPFWIQINNWGGMTQAEQVRILNVLQTKLDMKPQPGYNQVIIAHGFPSGVGLGQIPYMGTVIVRPMGQGNGYQIVAKLSLDDLTYLAGY